MGLFGVEAGIAALHEYRGQPIQYVKLGGVAEYFFDDIATIGGFGGVLIPTESSPPRSLATLQNGFYAGGHATFYANDNWALSGSVKAYHSEQTSSDIELLSLSTMGTLRYLTPMSGVELFFSGGYRLCEQDGPFDIFYPENGAVFLAGIKANIVGRDGSLLEIDRSNSIDTNVWSCFIASG